MLLSGLASAMTGLGVLALVYAKWVGRDYQATSDILLPVLGTLGLTLGFQNALGGFLLAIIGGHEARFLATVEDRAPVNSSVHSKRHEPLA